MIDILVLLEEWCGFGDCVVVVVVVVPVVGGEKRGV